MKAIPRIQRVACLLMLAIGFLAGFSSQGCIIPIPVSDGGLAVDLRNNKSASNPTWDQLLDFLMTDPTDEQAYYEGVRVCGDFAEELHNNAEEHDIRAGYVEIQFVDSEVGHALNLFETVDEGWVFVDCTGRDIGSVRPSLPGSGMDVSCEYDKIAYVEVGREYGLISIDAAESPTYAFYEDYVKQWEKYETALERYDSQTEAYDLLYNRCGGIASWGECSSLISMYDALEKERLRLDSMLEDLGSCSWESLGTVSDIDIHWQSRTVRLR